MLHQLIRAGFEPFLGPRTSSSKRISQRLPPRSSTHPAPRPPGSWLLSLRFGKTIAKYADLLTKDQALPKRQREQD